MIKFFGKPRIIKRIKLKADVFYKTHGNNQKLKNFTKLRKYTSIEEGLNNLISWFKLNKKFEFRKVIYIDEKKIYYWSPCLNPVGTVKSTLNSAISLKKFNKNYNVSIINVCGEWDDYKEKMYKNSINLIDLNFKYFNILPKRGFLASRLSYIINIFLSFLPLYFFLKKDKA